jgi:hypothetical protein
MSFKSHQSFFNRKSKKKQPTLVAEEAKNEKEVEFSPPLMVFTGIDSWPKRTNCLCLNCGFDIEGMPWFEPIQIEPTPVNMKMLENGLEEQGYSILRGGIFCSPNCVARWITDSNSSEHEKDNKRQMLNFVFRFMTGVEVKSIEPSPCRSQLRRFGGTMSDEEYKKIIENL